MFNTLSWSLIITFSLGVFAGGSAARGQEPLSQADLARLVQRQEELLRAQEAKLQELARRVEELETFKSGVEQRQAAAQAAPKAGGVVELPKHIDRLKIAGDLRVLYETRDQEVDNPKTASKGETSAEERARFRAQARLGFVWNSKDERWEVGVGLATGGSSGRSTTDTWGESELFEHGDLRLDYAYGRHAWTGLGGRPLSLTLGQQKSPFVTTFLNWDDDLRPTGLTAQLGAPLAKDYAGPFATAGLYQMLAGSSLQGVNNDAEVYLYAGQAGYAWRGERLQAMLAAGYWHVTHSFEDATRSGRYSYWNDKNGDGIVDSGELKTVDDYDPFKYSPGLYDIAGGYSFDVGDLYGEVNTRVGSLQIKGYGHVAMNFGAGGRVSQQVLPADERPADNDLGWLLGTELRYQKLRLGYAYAWIGADAVFGPLRDNGFGETAGLMDTDIQGHRLTAAYDVTPNFTLSLQAALLERIHGGSAAFTGDDRNDEADRTTYLQLSATYRF